MEKINNGFVWKNYGIRDYSLVNELLISYSGSEGLLKITGN